MKRMIIAITLIAQLLLAGAALAAPVVVNFAAMPDPGPHGITASVSYPVDGIFFRYDDFGIGLDAQVGSSGVYGTSGGSLIFDFTEPIASLNFNFTLQGLTAEPANPLALTLSLAGNPFADLAQSSYTYDGTTGTLLGNFVYAYTGPLFDQASMLFSPDLDGAFSFAISAISYETASSVPLPGAVWLLGAGLFGIMGRRRFAQRKAGQS